MFGPGNVLIFITKTADSFLTVNSLSCRGKNHLNTRTYSSPLTCFLQQISLPSAAQVARRRVLMHPPGPPHWGRPIVALVESNTSRCTKCAARERKNNDNNNNNWSSSNNEIQHAGPRQTRETQSMGQMHSQAINHPNELRGIFLRGL